MRVGVVFASTGGFKILRAIRSLRKTEPDFPIHVVWDVDSGTWRNGGGSAIADQVQSMPNVHTRQFHNTKHINGTLNEGMRWMRELGYEYVCLLHDDIIFSPLSENMHHLTYWFDRMDQDPKLMDASALTLSLIETGITGPDGDLFTGRQPPEWWDKLDLESEALWQRLLPEGKTPGFPMGNGPAYEVAACDWLPFSIRYFCGDMNYYTRLGPTGQIVPVKTWELIGGFDEKDGIHYDHEYPMECAIRNLPRIKVIPNAPHLHIHNQSIGYLDPSVGLWGNVGRAFDNKYGAFLKSEEWSRWLGHGVSHNV